MTVYLHSYGKDAQQRCRDAPPGDSRRLRHDGVNKQGICMTNATLNPTDGHLAELNPEQRAAATYGISASARDGGSTPPLLIIAGAGTGKTKTLTHRVAHLLLNGAD